MNSRPVPLGNAAQCGNSSMRSPICSTLYLRIETANLINAHIHERDYDIRCARILKQTITKVRGEGGVSKDDGLSEACILFGVSACFT